MKLKIGLLFIVLSLTACQTTGTKFDDKAALFTNASVKTLGIEAAYKQFINIKRRHPGDKTVPLAFVLKVCKFIKANKTNVREVIAEFGLPDSWLHNYGGIEAGGWRSEINGEPFSFSMYYSRSGVIRNASGLGKRLKFIFGVSRNTPLNELCVIRRASPK